MKKILLITGSLVVALTSHAQGIYNNGAQIVSETGSYWVIDRGSFILTSTGSTNLTSFANLIIQDDASLIITPLSCLTVNGTIINKAGNSGLVIQSSADGDGNLINNSTDISATVELYLTGGTATPRIFHYFVPPVATMSISNTLGDFATTATSLGLVNGANFAGDLVSYSESAAAADKNKGWQYYDGYRGTANYYSFAPFSSLVSSTGYNIGLWGNDKIIFKGTLNSNQHNFSDLGYSTSGWNLVGNPYPCNYDLEGISALTTPGNNVDKTVYFTKDGGYVYYNVYTSVGVGWTSPIVRPMQGFFVRVTSTGNSVTLPVISKTTSSAQSRAKGAGLNEAGLIKKLKLTLSNGSLSDETAVCLIDKATTGFDSDFDAYKFFVTNTIVPDIYTELSSVQYAINSVQGPVSEPVIIPVTVELKNQGTYRIDITEFENLDGISVVLKHGTIKTNISKGSSYSFTSNAGKFVDFELIFGNSLTAVETPAIQKLKTWYNNHFLDISCPDDIVAGNSTLTIYDLHGKPVYNNIQLYITPGQTIKLPINLPDGVYITRILVNNKPFISKIVVF